MKNVKIKQFLAILVCVAMISTMVLSLFGHVEAGVVSENNATQFKFNPVDILEWAAYVGADDDENPDIEWPFVKTQITNDMFESGEVISLTRLNTMYDNKLNASDAANILICETGLDSFEIIKRVAECEEVSQDDVSLKYVITLPETSGEIIYNLNKSNAYKNGNFISNLRDVSEERYAEIKANIKAIMENNKQGFISKKYENLYGKSYYAGEEEDWNVSDTITVNEQTFDLIDVYFLGLSEEVEASLTEEQLEQIENAADKYINYLEKRNFTVFSATATLTDGTEYKLVIGEGKETLEDDSVENFDSNWYLIKTASPESEFKTTLDYKSTPEGKMNKAKDTYLPPYYEDEDKDAKKDVDATAIIKSKTEEEIVATNGVALTDENTKDNPNSEGWYYPDVTNKTIIEKVYPFDKYNNPTDNGAVKETVKLTGKDGGEDTQKPSVEWTLRRINYDEKKNDDKTTTVTITYNLPIDEKSIPEGWKGIADEDGGIRKITRTFGPEESYDKDVTVEQNGPSTATVTTHVKIGDKAPNLGPQAGSTMAMVALGGIALAGFAVVSYRKFRK